MGRSKREQFEREKSRVAEIDDPDVREALLDFADAMDPEVEHDKVPQEKNGHLDGRESLSNSSAATYLGALRTMHERGLDLLNADGERVSNWFDDLVSEPDQRRYGIVGPATANGSEVQSKSSAKRWQSGLRGFFRWATEPGANGDRPSVAVEWPGNDWPMKSADSSTSATEETLPDGADLDAMREAALHSQNTRRDRAFLELAAGTGQRVYALVTLRVRHVHPDAEEPHVMLNPEIRNDGDKGAIEAAGRWRPIVSDPAPVREWLRNHPLRDPEVREEVGAPEEFGECYAFVGDLGHKDTDPADHWGTGAARGMLRRRKETTADLGGVETVEADVNPHAWRHYAYTRSQDVPGLDEPTRRRVFGWSPGSDMGERIYAGEEAKKAGQRFAERHREHYGEAGGESVAEQIVGDAGSASLTPEQRSALVDEILKDEEATRELIESAGLYTGPETDEMVMDAIGYAFERFAERNGMEVDGEGLVEDLINLSFETDDGRRGFLNPVSVEDADG